MKVLISIVFSLLLLGCNSNNQKVIQQDTTALDTLESDGTVTDTSTLVPETPQEAPKTIRTFKGLYIFGNEVSTFRDCNTGKIYWVEDESKRLSADYKKTMGFLSYPYESVYTEVKGYLKGKSTIGYAEEYENVLAVTKVNFVKPKSSKKECYDYDFIGFGNEPFWALEIIPSEKIIALKDVGSEKTYVFSYKASKTSGNMIIYESSNDKKESIKAIIIKETCSDGMSDNTYNYSLQVTINGKILKGCAVRKGEKAVMRQGSE